MEWFAGWDDEPGYGSSPTPEASIRRFCDIAYWRNIAAKQLCHLPRTKFALEHLGPAG